MKFSIRDLLLVTVIVALAMGWWVDRSKLMKQLIPLQILEAKIAVSKYRRGGNYPPASVISAPNPPKN